MEAVGELEGERGGEMNVRKPEVIIPLTEVILCFRTVQSLVFKIRTLSHKERPKLD